MSRSVGQTITVVTRPGASPGVRFFDCDRSLTGMAIERYSSADDPRLRPPAKRDEAGEGSAGSDARVPRPPDVLARRLFALGVTSVTVYSSVVTVEAPPDGWAELEPKVIETIEYLFHYYGDDAGWSPAALTA